MYVLSLFALAFAKRVQAKFETDNAFDYGLCMDCDQLREYFVGPIVADLC
jgi:hypothetical protein